MPSTRGGDVAEAETEAADSKATEPVTLYWGDKGLDENGARRAGTDFCIVGAHCYDSVVFVKASVNK